MFGFVRHSFKKILLRLFLAISFYFHYMMAVGSPLHFFFDDYLCENLMFCDKQFPFNVSMDRSYSL